MSPNRSHADFELQSTVQPANGNARWLATAMQRLRAAFIHKRPHGTYIGILPHVATVADERGCFFIQHVNVDVGVGVHIHWRRQKEFARCCLVPFRVSLGGLQPRAARVRDLASGVLGVGHQIGAPGEIRSTNRPPQTQHPSWRSKQLGGLRRGCPKCSHPNPNGSNWPQTAGISKCLQLSNPRDLKHERCPWLFEDEVQ